MTMAIASLLFLRIDIRSPPIRTVSAGPTLFQKPPVRSFLAGVSGLFGLEGARGPGGQDFQIPQAKEKQECHERTISGQQGFPGRNRKMSPVPPWPSIGRENGWDGLPPV